MNDVASSKSSPTGKASSFPVGMIFQFVGVLILLPGVVFLAAWTIAWWNAWAYYAAAVVVTLASRLAVAFRNPDLLAERGTAIKAGDAKPGDRLIVLLGALVLPTLTLVVAGLDHRFAWTQRLPAWVHITGLALLAVGYGLGAWAMVVNRFFSAVVRIQKERGHAVVSGGPYRLVRHPSYAGGLLATVGLPLLLNSWWAMIPSAAIVVLVFVRTALEDRTLQNELPGYTQYMQKTRSRLVPGVW